MGVHICKYSILILGQGDCEIEGLENKILPPPPNFLF